MEEKKGIYIAGALNADAVNYLHNVSKMMETAQLVKEAGFSILVPALDLLMGIKFGYKSYENYFDNNLVWVRKADALFLTPGWEKSKGTKREVEHAIANKVPVFERLDEMAEYFKGITGGNIVGLTTDEETGEVLGVLKHRQADPAGYRIELDNFNNESNTNK